MLYLLPMNKLRRFTKFTLSWRLSVLLILSCILGGTSQAYILPKLILNVIALLLIIHVLVLNRNIEFRDMLRVPTLFGVVFFFLFLLYFLPVPQWIWSKLSLREGVVYGQELLAIPSNWRPISLSAGDGFKTVWNFLPPIAVTFIMILDLKKKELHNALISIIFFGILTIIIGIAQFSLESSKLHLYPVSNVGYPTAHFSNTNHYSTFLVMILPVAVYLFNCVFVKTKNIKMKSLLVVLILAAIPLIILTDCLSGLILLPICFVLSLAPFYKRKYRSLIVLVLGLISLAVLISHFIYGNYWNELFQQIDKIGPNSRLGMYNNIWTNFEPFSLLGTGPGSFYDVYLGFEPRNVMFSKYSNAAHNDFLQVWLEMGLSGFGLMVIFCLYSGMCYFQNLLKTKDKLRVISAVSVIMVMAASISDYPLRTISLSVLLTFFTILMAGIQRKDYSDF